MQMSRSVPKASISAGHRAVRVPTVLSPASNQLLANIRYGDFNRRGWNLALTNVYDYRQQLFFVFDFAGHLQHRLLRF